MKTNFGEKLSSVLSTKLDGAEKNAISAIMIKNFLDSIVFCLIALLIGIMVVIFALPNGYTETEAIVTDYVQEAGKSDKVVLQYTVDGKEYTATVTYDKKIPTVVGLTATVYYNPENPAEVSTDNGSFIAIALGSLIILIGISAPISSAVTTSRWFKKRELEAIARQAQKTETKTDDAPLVNYTFASESLEHLNEVMMDNSKKFAIVRHKRTDNFNMKDENGNTVMTGRGCYGLQIFPTKFSINGYSEHRVRKALFSNGFSLSLGKFGNLSSDDIHSSDFVMDGKLFWENFYRDGYYFDREFDGIRKNYSICKNGVELIHISDRDMKTAMGVNQELLQNLPCKGQYDVTCREKDLEFAWTLCYLIYTIDL